ncbi:MAG: hypothetical protein ACYC3H_01415 [Bellilinea sp.]
MDRSGLRGGDQHPPGLILAAAACGEDPRAEPPPELRLAWQAFGFHALPEAGGLLDQPAGLLTRMTRIYNVWLAFKSYSQRDLSKHKEWVETNPALYETILRVKRLREPNA